VKIAIIGGYGKMGRWLAGFLHDDGKQVVISGRDENKLAQAAGQLGIKAATIAEAVSSSDVVVLSVPIDSFESAVKEIAPFIRPGQLIFDITSVKVMPVEIMHRYIKKGTVLGTHPMFGPGASSSNGQRFVLTPTGEREADLARKTGQYLEAKGARVIVMTPAEHDKMMSIVLGLSHFIALVTADTLVSLDSLKKASEIGGTTYRMLLTLAESVVSEDPGFYASLQANLPHMGEIHKLFQNKAEDWAELVRNRDSRQFVQRMGDLKDTFAKEDPDFARAYENMYRVAGGF